MYLSSSLLLPLLCLFYSKFLTGSIAYAVQVCDATKVALWYKAGLQKIILQKVFFTPRHNNLNLLLVLTNLKSMVCKKEM